MQPKVIFKKAYCFAPSLALFCGLMFASSAPTAAGAAPLQVLSGHVPATVSSSPALGRLAGTNILRLAISLPSRDPQGLTNLLHELYDPGSVRYHQYLTPPEFTAQFGAATNDYEALVAFAQANGFKVTARHPNRLVLDVTAPASTVESAFHLELQRYQHPKESREYYAPDREPSLALGVKILHISGLDNLGMARPRLQSKPLGLPADIGANNGSGPSGAYMGLDFRAAYASDTPLDGSGQVVGLLQFDGYQAYDIAYYESKAGLPNVLLQNVLVDGASGQPSGSSGQIEVSLDIEMAISMAPNLAKVVVYEAPNPSPFVDLLSRMANDNAARQLSCSWYVPNGTAEPAADLIFQQMAAQGQSFFCASGDNDAYTGLIDYPSDTPYITQVGGTTLSTTSRGGAWAAETVWNWGPEYGRDGIGSGGGISTQYPIPSWQTNINMTANQGSSTRRNTPDVALTADNVYVRAVGSDLVEGGTSCAAPLWAGFMALANQQAAQTGQPAVGFANPALDIIGSGPQYSLAFHDITTGNNTWSESPAKFQAVSGYDLCTGWGTPAGVSLINALANPEPLLITPTTGFTAIGGVGGPFSMTSESFVLTNAGSKALNWTLSNTSVWLTASSLGGTLPSASPAQTVSVALNAVAANLPVGTYEATLWFTNTTDGIGQARTFALSIIRPPEILAEPTNQAVLEGAGANFTVEADGGQPLAYQWQLNGTNLPDGGKISGSGSPHLTIASVAAADVGNYSVVVTNFAGTITSSIAVLTLVLSAPVITLEPANQNAVVGATTQFSVGVIGTHPFAYQWSFNGTNLPDATNAVLRLSGIQMSQAGNYSVTVSNLYGETNSSPAVLAVYAQPVALFFDDFDGPILNTNWQASLPDAYCGSFPANSAQIAPYGGAPDFDFETLGTNSVLRLTNVMGPLVRRGWSSSAVYNPADFRYEVRFNTMVQSEATSIDGFLEIWIMDGMDNSRYDIISPFEGAYSGDPYFFVGSSIDGSYTRTSCPLQNNTWYRLIVQAPPGQNIRGSICTDDGTELIGYTFAHGASAYTNGFQLAISQTVGSAGAAYPVDVAVDYASLASGFPPTIQTQPASQFAHLGETVTFNVSATGTGPLYYQWTFNGTDLDGATNAVLVLSDVQETQAGNYTVEVSNPYGSTLSSNALLVVGSAPSIVTQPASQTVAAGNTITFSVSAGGTPPLSYQWMDNGTNITGATDSSFTLSSVRFDQAGSYSVVVTNAFGSATSSNAILTIYGAPVVTTQPTNQNVTVGGTASFVAVAEGTPPLSYQWIGNGTNLPGATNATLVLTNVQLAQAGLYALSVSNIYGGTLSSNAQLSVNAIAPFITTQPHNVVVSLGDTATFTVGAGGTGPLAYQWTLSGTNLPTATNSSLVLTNVQYLQAGNYQVAITSPYGATNSAVAVLTVNSPLATYFFDDFNGPSLNAIWQPPLPNAYSGSFPSGSAQIAPYSGTPNFDFETLGTNSVLRITNVMGPLTRRGWASTTNFGGTNFYYETRFNSLVQSSTTSIDGFIEIWIMDAANSNRYDIISPFAGAYGGDRYFFMGSSIDGAYTKASFSFQNNTWYHLVLQSAPGQNLRGSIYSDTGMELISHTFNHDFSAYPSGFKIVISHVVGSSGGSYPINVLADYTRITQFPPAIILQPTNETVTSGLAANFTALASGVLPLHYQWAFNGTNIAWATNATLTVTNAQLSQAGSYSVTVTNGYGAAVSTNALLVVDASPSIYVQPTNITARVGDSAIFAVSAAGSQPLNYQWFWGQNGSTNAITGATNGSLVLIDIQSSNAGIYFVMVTNSFGSATSSNALLTVTDVLDHFAWNPIPSPRFANSPFSVTIQTFDIVGQPYTNFTGSVMLTATNGMPVYPPFSAAFIQGAWTGTVMVAQATSNLVLQASDAAGHLGLANPVTVLNTPPLQSARSGNFLFLFWPIVPSNFVLETSTNLAAPVWTPIPVPPTQIGDQFLESVQLNDSKQFYRLRYTLP